MSLVPQNPPFPPIHPVGPMTCTWMPPDFANRLDNTPFVNQYIAAGSTPDRVSCSLCNKCFKSKDFMLKHLIKKHDKKKEYEVWSRDQRASWIAPLFVLDSRATDLVRAFTKPSSSSRK